PDAGVNQQPPVAVIAVRVFVRDDRLYRRIAELGDGVAEFLDVGRRGDGEHGGRGGERLKQGRPSLSPATAESAECGHRWRRTRRWRSPRRWRGSRARRRLRAEALCG